MTSRPTAIFQLDIKTAQNVAPELHGVYTLFDQEYNVVYYGKAEKQTLRKRLLQHIESGDECMRNACYFSLEVVKNPGKVAIRKLKAFEAANGRLPECHEKLMGRAKNVARVLAIDGVLTTAFLN